MFWAWTDLDHVQRSAGRRWTRLGDATEARLFKIAQASDNGKLATTVERSFPGGRRAMRWIAATRIQPRLLAGSVS